MLRRQRDIRSLAFQPEVLCLGIESLFRVTKSMETNLISLLVAIIIFGAIFAVIYYVPVVAWVKMIANILVGAVAAVWFIRFLIAFLH